MTTMNLFDMTDTWNAGATTFTAIKMNVTDTASASGSLLMDLQVGGTSQFSVRKDGRVLLRNGIRFADTGNGGVVDIAQYGTHVSLASGIPLVWESTATITGSQDLFLVRDAADTLALRRTTNAQAFRIYNTFTDASNYERGFIRYTSNVLTIGHEALGSGTEARNISFRTNGAQAAFIDTAGGLYGQVSIGVTSNFVLRAPSTGVVTLYNWDANNFDRLQFGGTTSSFPALKRSGTALETKLADDSAYAPHAAQYIDVTDGITAPAAATGRARIYVDAADGDLKVIFADGTIKTIVTDT